MSKIFVVLDVSGEEVSPLLVTVDRERAVETAKQLSTPGGVDYQHEGGHHAVVELEAEELCAVDGGVWTFYDCGEQVG